MERKNIFAFVRFAASVPMRSDVVEKGRALGAG